MDLKNFKLMPFYDLDKKWAILTSGDKEKYYSNDPVHKMYIGEVIDIIDRR